MGRDLLAKLVCSLVAGKEAQPIAKQVVDLLTPTGLHKISGQQAYDFLALLFSETTEQGDKSVCLQNLVQECRPHNQSKAPIDSRLFQVKIQMKQISALVKSVQKQASLNSSFKPALKKVPAKKKKKKGKAACSKQDQLSGCVDSSVDQQQQQESESFSQPEPVSNFTLSTLFHTTMNLDIEDDPERSIRIPSAVLPKSIY